MTRRRLKFDILRVFNPVTSDMNFDPNSMRTSIEAPRRPINGGPTPKKVPRLFFSNPPNMHRNELKRHLATAKGIRLNLLSGLIAFECAQVCLTVSITSDGPLPRQPPLHRLRAPRAVCCPAHRLPGDAEPPGGGAGGEARRALQGRLKNPSGPSPVLPAVVQCTRSCAVRGGRRL